jgi:hypothetical protein
LALYAGFDLEQAQRSAIAREPGATTLRKADQFHTETAQESIFRSFPNSIASKRPGDSVRRPIHFPRQDHAVDRSSMRFLTYLAKAGTGD